MAFGSRREECEVTVPHFHISQVEKESTMRAAQLFLLAALSFTSLETASAQPPAKPAEPKVLDRVEGKWRFEWKSKPTELDPKGSKGSGTSTNEWILDGWFQQHKGKVADGGPRNPRNLELRSTNEDVPSLGVYCPGGGRYEGPAPGMKNPARLL